MKLYMGMRLRLLIVVRIIAMAVFFLGVQHRGLVGLQCSWVWLNCQLSGVFYCEWTIVDGLLSVIRSSGVSTIQGFLMH